MFSLRLAVLRSSARRCKQLTSEHTRNMLFYRVADFHVDWKPDETQFVIVSDKC